MLTAMLTTKGRITLPKAVRESLRLRTGDRVAFVVQGRSEATMRPLTKSVDEVFGKLWSPLQPHRTVEEMNAGMAEEMTRRNRPRPGRG